MMVSGSWQWRMSSWTWWEHSSGPKISWPELSFIVVTLIRGKFGELFYRLVVIDIKSHPKGLIVELGLLLDPNIDNLKDIETSLEDQVREIRDGIIKIVFQARKKTLGGFKLGKFGFYVEEYKAVPFRFIYIFFRNIIANIYPRFCKYFKRDVWSKDRILDTSMFLK